MFSASPAIREAMRENSSDGDGRRARSAASRNKIILAMMDLVADGHANPSAARVAEKAGVGLRSVFRHFDDKETIFREIDRILVRAFGPIMDAPFQSGDWQGQLFELIERRCEVNEKIANFRMLSMTVRYRSEFVKHNYRQLIAQEEAALNAILPNGLQTDTRSGQAVLIATSFDTWRLLRLDKELSSSETVASIKGLVTDILDHAGVSR